jgi:hypothetical protein
MSHRPAAPPLHANTAARAHRHHKSVTKLHPEANEIMTRHHRPHPPLAPLADRVPRRDCPWIYAHRSIHLDHHTSLPSPGEASRLHAPSWANVTSFGRSFGREAGKAEIVASHGAFLPGAALAAMDLGNGQACVAYISVAPLSACLRCCAFGSNPSLPR